MNRGVEIDGTLADDINRSVIQEQVEMGVAVRMAVMELLIKNQKNAFPGINYRRAQGGPKGPQKTSRAHMLSTWGIILAHVGPMLAHLGCVCAACQPHLQTHLSTCPPRWAACRFHTHVSGRRRIVKHRTTDRVWSHANYGQNVSKTTLLYKGVPPQWVTIYVLVFDYLSLIHI